MSQPRRPTRQARQLALQHGGRAPAILGTVELVIALPRLLFEGIVARAERKGTSPSAEALRSLLADYGDRAQIQAERARKKAAAMTKEERSAMGRRMRAIQLAKQRGEG